MCELAMEQLNWVDVIPHGYHGEGIVDDLTHVICGGLSSTATIGLTCAVERVGLPVRPFIIVSGNFALREHLWRAEPKTCTTVVCASMTQPHHPVFCRIG